MNKILELIGGVMIFGMPQIGNADFLFSWDTYLTDANNVILIRISPDANPPEILEKIRGDISPKLVELLQDRSGLDRSEILLAVDKEIEFGGNERVALPFRGWHVFFVENQQVTLTRDDQDYRCTLKSVRAWMDKKKRKPETKQPKTN